MLLCSEESLRAESQDGVGDTTLWLPRAHQGRGVWGPGASSWPSAGRAQPAPQAVAGTVALLSTVGFSLEQKRQPEVSH